MPKVDRLDNNIVRASFTQIERADPGLVAPPPEKFELTIPKAVPGSEAPLVTLPADPAERPAAVARLFPQLPPLPEEPVAAPRPGRPSLHASRLPTTRGREQPGIAAGGIRRRSGPGAHGTGRPLSQSDDRLRNQSQRQQHGLDHPRGLHRPIGQDRGQADPRSRGARMGMIVAELALKQTRYAWPRRSGATSTLSWSPGKRSASTEASPTSPTRFSGCKPTCWGAGSPPATSRRPCGPRPSSFASPTSNPLPTTSMPGSSLSRTWACGSCRSSAVAGQVDRLIPYYDYDEVLANVLQNHTNILTARANLEAARYNLKLAQVTPVPDVDVRADIWKEHQVQPLQNYFTFQFGIPFPIWDRNQGGIVNAAAAMVRAAEGPHAAEVNLTTNLATAYATYKNNLFAMEYYRRNILPDQVRYYRGVFDRRQIDPAAAFGDLVQAQQVFVADVTAYLGILGSLWTSVVGVADFLQTDDLYQLGKPLALPDLPDLETLHAWPCPHPNAGSEPAAVQTAPAPVPHAAAPTARHAERATDDSPAERQASEATGVHGTAHTPIPGQTARSPDQKLPAHAARIHYEFHAGLAGQIRQASATRRAVLRRSDFRGGPARPARVRIFTPTPFVRSSATSSVGGAL